MAETEKDPVERTNRIAWITATTGAVLLAAIIAVGGVIGSKNADAARVEKATVCLEKGNTPSECALAFP